MDVKLTDNTAKSRFEIEVEGATAFIDYRIRDGIVYLIHTETPEELRGKGIGSVFVKKVFEFLETEGLQFKSLCPFVSHYLQKHPEWDFLVASK